MRSRSGEIVWRARSLIGTRFRPQGRGREGVDCVGLAAFALGLAEDRVPRNYALRGASAEEVGQFLRDCGMDAVKDAAPGDLALFAPGPAQLHFAVMTGNGLVHADLGLGRVVERPLPAPWPLIGLWRPSNGNEVQRWRPWS